MSEERPPQKVPQSEFAEENAGRKHFQLGLIILPVASILKEAVRSIAHQH